MTNQHLQALKVAKQDSFESLITTILKAKINQTTMQEWKEYSRDHTDVPPYSLLLEFVDLWARDIKNTTRVERKRPMVTSDREANRVSYVTTKLKDYCVACNTADTPPIPLQILPSIPA